MRIFVVVALLISGGVVRADDAATPATIAAMQKKLVGKHALTLQWLGDNKTKGSVEITPGADGQFPLAITGKQDAGKDGSLEIVGVIDRVAADRFFFTGKITTTVSHINGGAACVRDGQYEFVAKGGRRYWRMYPVDNPCDKVADYVDVHFTK